MKKFLMSLALSGTFAAMSAKGDSYIYWMVEDATYGAGGAPVEFTMAQLYAVGQDGVKPADPIGVWALDKGSTAVSSTEKNVSTWSVDTGLSDYSFLVELYNDADEVLTQGSFSYDFVKNSIYTHLNPPGVETATFSTFNVPEPTSGLLMLIGLCGLALKRKRA